MPERAELWRKTGQKGLLIASYKRLEKRHDRAITSAAEAVCVPEHSAPPGSLQAKQLHHLHSQLSLEQSCHGQKKKKKFLCLRAQGHLGAVQLFATLYTVTFQASLSERGFSGQEYWSVLANTRCHTLLGHCISCCPTCQLPELLQPSSCTTSTPGRHRSKPKPSRAASEAKPQQATRI